MIKQIIIILMLSILANIQTINLFAQQNDNYEFAIIKSIDNGFTVYFDVINLKDEQHIDQVLSAFRIDENILKATHFKSNLNKDRFNLEIKTSVNANYIHKILFDNDADFDLSTININEQTPITQQKTIEHPASSPKINIEVEGFPKYIDTGNPIIDRENYDKKKSEWIKKNPELYQKMLNDIK